MIQHPIADPSTVAKGERSPERRPRVRCLPTTLLIVMPVDRDAWQDSGMFGAAARCAEVGSGRRSHHPYCVAGAFPAVQCCCGLAAELDGHDDHHSRVRRPSKKPGPLDVVRWKSRAVAGSGEPERHQGQPRPGLRIARARPGSLGRPNPCCDHMWTRCRSGPTAATGAECARDRARRPATEESRPCHHRCAMPASGCRCSRRANVDLLVADLVPVVSFTFGIPELVGAVRSAVSLPIIAAGGLATAGDVAAAVHAGADAVMVGTALLRTDEADGSRAPYATSSSTSTTASRRPGTRRFII